MVVWQDYEGEDVKPRGKPELTWKEIAGEDMMCFNTD